MDRFINTENRDDNTASDSEFVVKVDPTKRMVAFELETDSEDVRYMTSGVWSNRTEARFNLLAVTGVRVEPDTAREDTP
jgi:hypothetical protein